MMAPITLVAANVIPRRITDVRIVPKMPVRKADNPEQTQLRVVLPLSIDAPRVIARYTTAIPKRTHKNAGVNVITAVMLRKAAIIPIITLAIIAIPVQFGLQLQFKLDIYFHLQCNYMPKNLDW